MRHDPAVVLILLPPSEGKTAPDAGPPVDLEGLSFPELNARRERLLDALERLAARPVKTAVRALGISLAQAAEVQRDGRLRSAPAAPAWQVYTGVLYEHLRFAELDPAARSRVLIASGLWGMLGADDAIPAYRLSMGARLPRIGPLPAYWRASLRKALPDEGLMVDLRSGTYAAAWAPRAATVVTVRGFVERDGRRTVVSHMVKATRGDVARILLSSGGPPAGPEEVAHAVATAGHRVELTAVREGWSLDVIG
jgi:cytoplasmic iron level regulating protein YaaA (DUF328/UPF0246 family)